MRMNHNPVPLIKYYAHEYSVDPDSLVSVAECESNLKHTNIYGDGGAAYGLYQYHKGTFDSFTKSSGLAGDYKDRESQIQLTAWAFTKGLETHWTCARLVGII